jgi:hypothetical protein
MCKNMNQFVNKSNFMVLTYIFNPMNKERYKGIKRNVMDKTTEFWVIKQCSNRIFTNRKKRVKEII